MLTVSRVSSRTDWIKDGLESPSAVRLDGLVDGLGGDGPCCVE